MLILIRNLYNLLLFPLAAPKQASIRVTSTHLTLSLKAKKSQFQSEEVIFKREVSQVQPKI